MSSVFFPSDAVIEPRTWHAHELPADLCSYQEHLDHGTPVVFGPDSDSIKQSGLRPNGYCLTTNEWDVEIRTPLYARTRARHQRLRPGWTETDLLAKQTAMRLREELRNDASVVFLAGRTADCCGRVSELAIFDSAGRPIFDETLAPHNGEQCDHRGVKEFWPCARLHQYRGEGGAPFSHWARQLAPVLRYRNRNHALKDPGLQARGGQARSRIVVWGTSLLQALHREYAFAHGHPRNGKIQQVKDELRGLNICDLQVADLLWRGDWPGGVAELAHLDGTTAGDDCRRMHEHLRLLTQDPYSTTARADPLPRVSPFRTGPPQPFIMAAAPSADTLAEREGWKFRDSRITSTGAPRRLLPVQEPLADPEDLLRITGLDHDGATDVLRVATQRREQAKLRRYLLADRTSATCDLCGRTLPISYLHVAHVKRREDADEDERRDLAIVMLACVLGCDALFEQGEVYVDEHGVIRARRSSTDLGTDLSAAVKALEGLRCMAHSPHSERYFRAHRERHGNSTTR
ncbi:hypothetical protein [Sphaerisporangium perillae]|uniref:hypothetical protein n=1 Tax=Sphaerisporangium perillae TaxID=2935860 RepID=UPI00200DA5D4|nr:hypothetical protein [Sphaerisporangium perillae]